MSRNGKKSRSSLMCLFSFAVFALGLLLVLSVRWMTSNWAELTMEEFLFQMRTLSGTGGGMFEKYALNAVLPVLAALAVLAVLGRFIRKDEARTAFAAVLFAAGALMLAAGTLTGGRFLKLGSWIRSFGRESGFVEDNYADPHEVSIRFPEKKRNLIYLYLESMEVGFADPADGGVKEVSRIPELTGLAYEDGHENFSGQEKTLNGAFSPYGTTWTIGGMFAQTSGLPLKISIDRSAMYTQESFFPGIRTLGDILEDEGYRQILMVGSDAVFGGRELYFTEHGHYEMRDYNWAKETGRIPPDYKVFWGFEDEKLYEFARDTLTELAGAEEPFNLTLLTVDTHFPDGYVCEDCEDAFGEDYDNALSCSSRKAAEFVRWIKEQPFYENTTIVLCGDHPTMKSGYMDGVPEEERKTYTLIINGAAENKAPGSMRLYSTFDLFPTTLAAMGAEIEGNRLGLGTNLYSGDSTLEETVGFTRLNEELEKPSALLSDLMKTDTAKEGYIIRTSEYAVPEISAQRLAGEDAKYLIRVENAASMTGMNGNTVRVTAALRDADGEESNDYEMVPVGGGAYQCIAELPDPADRDCRMRIVSRSDKGYERVLYDGFCRPDLEAGTDFSYYLTRLAGAEDVAVFIAIRDEATNSLTESMQKQLHALGLKETLLGQFRTDYLAVIDRGETVFEKMSPESITGTGTLSDGRTWSMESSRDENNTNTRASIVIDGTEYSQDRQGLNFVVYSYESGEVIQSKCFNTFRNWPYAWLTVDSGSYAADNMLLITMEDNDSDTNTAVGWVWNERLPETGRGIALEHEDYTKLWHTAVSAEGMNLVSGDIVHVTVYGGFEDEPKRLLCETSWQVP